MNSKVLHTLEFDKICGILSEYCGSAPAKRLCDNLRPSSDPEWIERSQQETSAALTRLLKNDRLSFGANFDLRNLLKEAGLGRALSMGELLAVARLLHCVGDLYAYGEGFEEEDCLSARFAVLDPLPSLYEEIERCIRSEDEMADDASKRLKEIRSSFSVISGRIHSQLNRMVNESLRTYLQDAVVTMRGDRYCIPVKAEYKSKVPGIVHDQSSTGSTFFIEPAVIVEMNNQLGRLKQEEDEEIRRILLAFTAKVAEVSDIIGEDQKNLTMLDFIFGKAKYALKFNAVKPVYNEKHIIRLKKARHPLLDPAKAVPIDVTLGDLYDLLVVTGPNTGGKTVSLKTVGLLTLMGQAGLHIPAGDRSELSLFTDVFADIGDEQSIEQSLSTFSSHMVSIVSILKKAGPDSLCLFDELGAGTDPTEGATLATAILEHLHGKGIRTMATTHYSELKLYALSTPGVENAGCEFNVETLSPTYRLLTGIPGKSNAFAISKKLGLSDAIIDAASKHISSDAESFETVISELNEKRKLFESEREAFMQDKAALEKRIAELEDREQKFEAKKDKILSSAREEARDLLQEAKDVADETIRAFNKQGGQMKLSTMEKKRSDLRSRVSAQEEALYKGELKLSRKKVSTGEELSASEAKPGVRVHVLSMDMDGVIESAPDKDGVVKVRCGIISSRVPLAELVKSSDTEPEKNEKRTARPLDLSKVSGISPEINVIGATVDEAVARLEKYLDDAYMSHVEKVRIVHGKGTGALRKGIHDYLRYNSIVKSFALASHGEGDAGVTIVEFR
ncbi:MAG: endonuclease MutS2 [Lachnospiraceae bacterium]|nr:endonuclease MutS2 [Lachnospiraceae bacterium]